MGEVIRKIQSSLTKNRVVLIFLVVFGFFYRAYPHLFLIPRWITEEQHQFIVVKTLIDKGLSFQTLTQTPNLFLSHIVVYFLWFFTQINPIIISQYFNALVAILTTIPIYFLGNILLKKENGIYLAIFWTFNESVFYRTSIFVSTEIVGFFFLSCAFYFYLKKKKVLFITCMGICLFSHYLVFLFGSFTILLLQFLYRTRKLKLVSIGVVGLILFILSTPLNPHSNLSGVPVLIGKINLQNLYLYSLLDFMFGFQIFFGTIILGICTIVVLNKPPQHNKLIVSWLIVSTGVVIFSLVTYAAYLPSVPRLVFYFVIPLSFYTIQFISSISKFKKILLVIIICTSMVISSSLSLQPMLFINDSLTSNEYKAIEEIRSMGLFNDSRLWWSDYSARIEISSFCIPLVRINEPQWTGEQERLFSIQICNYEYTFTHLKEFAHKFKYVFLSERMKKNGLFIIVGETGNRSEIIRQQVVDIWSNLSEWELLYNHHECWVYHRIEA